MQYPSLIGHSAELCRIIKKSSQPADALASEYMRSRKYIGSRDRKFISEVTFFALRALSACEYMSETSWLNITDDNQEIPPICHEIGLICSAWMFGRSLRAFSDEELTDSAYNFHETIAYVFKDKCLIADESKAHRWIEQYTKSEEEILRILNSICTTKDEKTSVAWCLPEWVIDSLHSDGMSFDDIRLLAKSLLFPAPLTLRVKNPEEYKGTVQTILRNEGIQAEETSLSPAGLCISKRVNLQQFSVFKEGFIEVHDEGSQLIGFAVNPSEYDVVLDACAGAGGKSLHIADLQKDTGEIISTDIEFKRLKEISLRAKRGGYSSIRPILLHPKKEHKDLKRYRGRCDLVLVDAPCSGMGTVRRMPMAKWRTTPKLIDKLSLNQRSILEHNAQYVKIGGSLVYATCSFLPQENIEVVTDFLDNNQNFIPENLADIMSQHSIYPEGMHEHNHYLTLYPSIHKTDGFFVARMKRVS